MRGTPYLHGDAFGAFIPVKWQQSDDFLHVNRGSWVATPEPEMAVATSWVFSL
jgi:hypothetical protein